MYIEYLYGIFGVLLAYLATLTDSIILSILLNWVAISLLVVFVGYMTNQPRIFRKRTDGSIPTAIRIIFLPFMVGVQLYNYAAKSKDAKRDRHYIHHIQDDIYLASRLSAEEALELREHEVKAVLDVTAEFDALDWSSRFIDMDYLNIPILDHRSPTTEQLRQALNWIDNKRKQNKPVMVHCALGRGRSLFCVAAYLLAKHPELEVRDVLTSITDIRNQAGLNKKQLKRLIQYREAGLLTLMQPAWLIANPVSGQGKWPKYQLKIQAFLEQHYNLKVVETTEEKSAQEWAKEAVDNKASIVIAAGGDGTLAEVATELINSDVKFGIIPLGTANALAHTLFGISSKVIPIETAIKHIISDNTIKMDTAKCNDKTMLLVAAVGIEQQMIKSADRETKNKLGQFAYLHGFWQAVNTEEKLDLMIQFDSKPAQNIKTNSLVIANAAPFSTVLAQGHGTPNFHDGLLNITWFDESNTVIENISDAASLMIAGLSEAPTSNSIHKAKAEKITIRSKASIGYVIDGETFEANEIKILVQPASLNILLDPNTTTAIAAKSDGGQ
ncbi:diacylglycerol kinase family protein [Psychrosphaera sp.]|nr:diacylglycerol kinase family protein [Psychrosphaera sp.]